MRRIQLVSVALRLAGLGLLAATGWTVNLTAGLATTGAAVLAVVYLPESDA